ncbi:MAG: membrane-binding protein [Bacteroidota bacterium]
MKFTVTLILLSILIVSCTESRATKELPALNSTEIAVEIPDKVVHKSLLTYDNKTSLWSLNDERYSGYLVSFHADSTLKEKTGILNGRKQNQSSKWYPDGRLQEVANYHQGKLHEEKKMWTADSNHILIAHLNYQSGKAHGEQTQWYATGELYKKLNLKMGREEGIQQAFRKNGELYANYEARNGRIFGLKKAALCYGLEDENVKYDK